MVLDPITLIDCVITPIGRVADVEVKEKLAIECARRMKQNLVGESESG